MIMAATADKTLQSVLRSLGKDAGSTDASSYEVKLCSPMVVAIRMFTHLCFVLRADWWWWPFPQAPYAWKDIWEQARDYA
jgi:hypothetical protein